MPITPARAVEIVKLIASHDDDQTIPGLIELLHAVADPDGDALRYALAMKAIEHAFTYTPSFDEALEEYLAGARPADVLVDNIG